MRENYENRARKSFSHCWKFELKTIELNCTKFSKMKLESFLGCLELEFGGIAGGYFHLIFNWMIMLASIVLMIFTNYFGGFLSQRTHFYKTVTISDDGSISLLTKVIETRARCIAIFLSCSIFYFTWQFLIGIEKVSRNFYGALKKYQFCFQLSERSSENSSVQNILFVSSFHRFINFRRNFLKFHSSRSETFFLF